MRKHKASLFCFLLSGLIGFATVASLATDVAESGTASKSRATAGSRQKAKVNKKAALVRTKMATVGRLTSDLTYIASDELEGRGVGTDGLNKAADHIRDIFKASGLDVTRVNKGAFQEFQLGTGAGYGKVNELAFHGPNNQKIALSLVKNFRPCTFGASGKFDGGIVFCGYGLESKGKDYEDFNGVDVKGKIVILMRRFPGQKQNRPLFTYRQSSLSVKYANAIRHGAAAVLFVNDPHFVREGKERLQKAVSRVRDDVVMSAELLEQQETAEKKDKQSIVSARRALSVSLRRLKSAREALSEETDVLIPAGYGGKPRNDLKPMFHITQKSCNQLLKAAANKTLIELGAAIDQTKKPQSFALKGWSAKGEVNVKSIQYDVKNVIGVLEGNGALANETVVVGAHYDHVGYGRYGSRDQGNHSIHNGADDNGSGTVCLLELVRRLGTGLDQKKPRRRIVFIAFTAEELGLIGSKYYVNNPLFPLNNTVAMINMDMVGRLHDGGLTIFGVDTASHWRKLLTACNTTGGKLNLQAPGIGPSDHASFYRKKMPVLHFFTDLHPDYHRPSDDVHRVNIDGMAAIVDMVEKVVLDTASRKERPKYVAVRGSARVNSRYAVKGRPYVGLTPSFANSAKGCTIFAVAADGPAAKAGLKVNDVIVAIGEKKVTNFRDYAAILSTLNTEKAKQFMIRITVLRGKERLTKVIRWTAP